MSSSLPPIRRIASNLLLRGGELLRNPVVEVGRDGEILSVECYANQEAIDRTPTTEFYSGVMMAGFVNVHCHLELSYLRGKIEAGGGFASFASSIAKVRGVSQEEERKRAMERSVLEMLHEGIVAVGDIVNGDSSFGLKSRSSILYHSFAELFGLREVDASAIKPLLSYPNTTSTPHSIYSLNESAFHAAITTTKSKRLSIHFMESPAEAELFRGEGRLHDWYSQVGFECDFLHYASPAERVIRCIPHDQSVIFVHNTTIEERDIDLIMSHFTAPIYWALCPRSNHYISRMSPPTDLLRRKGAQISIGTDSLASNSSLSILEELKLLRGVPLAERLDWATRGGAAALGLEKMGEIEVGYHPGINILSGIDYLTMELTDRSRVTRLL